MVCPARMFVRASKQYHLLASANQPAIIWWARTQSSNLSVSGHVSGSARLAYFRACEAHGKGPEGSFGPLCALQNEHDTILASNLYFYAKAFCRTDFDIIELEARLLTRSPAPVHVRMKCALSQHPKVFFDGGRYLRFSKMCLHDDGSNGSLTRRLQGAGGAIQPIPSHPGC